MRLFLLTTAVASLAFAQSSSRQYVTRTYDSDGRAQVSGSSAATSAAGGSSHSETARSINGRSVPLEQVEEKVLSDGPSGRVVERVIRRFDSNGRAVSSEKVRTEERRDAAGGSTKVTTVYDSDINGRFAVRERATEQTTRSGETMRTEATVERPNINGSLGTFEKRQSVQTGPESNRLTSVEIYRDNGNGGLAHAARQTIQSVKAGDEVTETTAVYNTAITGQMELAGQTVSRTQKNADGSEVQVVDVYGGNYEGRAASGYEAGLKLREQQLIERRPGQGGALVETFSVRRSNLESGTLGPARKVSETVCTGKCVPDPPAPATP